MAGGMKVRDFREMRPIFRLEDFFVGRTSAWGMFEDRFGAVRRQFRVVVTGSMEGETLVLDEDFNYADGETERRVWRLHRSADGWYEGHAEGVVGVARGQAMGNAFNWKYVFDLNVGERGVWRVSFDDWMFLQPDGVLINRAWVRRWGIKIGSVTLFFRKEKSSNESPAPEPQRGAHLAVVPPRVS